MARVLSQFKSGAQREMKLRRGCENLALGPSNLKKKRATSRAEVTCRAMVRAMLIEVVKVVLIEVVKVMLIEVVKIMLIEVVRAMLIEVVKAMLIEVVSAILPRHCRTPVSATYRIAASPS